MSSTLQDCTLDEEDELPMEKLMPFLSESAKRASTTHLEVDASCLEI